MLELIETRTYNNLLQMVTQQTKMVAEQTPSYLNMTYNYSATQNNGRITSSVDAITGESVTYGYDGWNRLTSAAASGMWSAGYTYDGFGNLLTKAGTGGAPNATYTYDGNNRETAAGVTFDANGNRLTDAATTNTWTIRVNSFVLSATA